MKNFNNKNFFVAIIILFGVQAGLLGLFYYGSKSQATMIDYDQRLVSYSLGNSLPLAGESGPVHYSYFSDKDFYEEAYYYGGPQVISQSKQIKGGIIPHHLIVKDKLGAYFKALEKFEYETVVLIGPDHFDRGNGAISTSKGVWQTPYGSLWPENEIIEKLDDYTFISIDEDPFEVEHSISGLVPFIKRSLPKTKIVPIIVKLGVSEDEVAKLAEVLSGLLDDEKTLVLASVDFSHYQTALTADFHDQKSNGVISVFDLDRLSGLEVDSPGSLYAVLKYLELKGAQKSQLVYSTNSGYLINQPENPTTSHNFYYFSDGKKESTQTINFLFFGDLMIDRYVKTLIDRHGIDSLFAELAGEENRFFDGVDVISANLEGAVTNNGDHYPPNMGNDFAFNPDLVSSLKKYNFNYFNMANNHLADQSEQGIAQTYQHLKEMGYDYSGCRDGQLDTCSTTIINIGDKKIGMFGYSLVYSQYNSALAKQQIKLLKGQTDLVIVNMHWGNEYQFSHNSKQEMIGHELVDFGADLIIGHHSHVVQDVEFYKDKAIFYSLGNFIFDQYFSSETQKGLAVGINLVFDQDEVDFEYYLFPLQSNMSRVSLMKGATRQNLNNRVLSEVEEKDLDKIYY